MYKNEQYGILPVVNFFWASKYINPKTKITALSSYYSYPWMPVDLEVLECWEVVNYNLKMIILNNQTVLGIGINIENLQLSYMFKILSTHEMIY